MIEPGCSWFSMDLIYLQEFDPGVSHVEGYAVLCPSDEWIPLSNVWREDFAFRNSNHTKQVCSVVYCVSTSVCRDNDKRNVALYCSAH